MEKSVSAADANRRFSHILKSVREGHSFIVTSHDKPVARIVPIDRGAPAAVQARNVLLERLRRQRTVNIGTWTRDELYENGS